MTNSDIVLSFDIYYLSLTNIHQKLYFLIPVRHLIRYRDENRKSRFSLKPEGMAELKVAAVNRNANRGWKKENVFLQLDLLLCVAKIEP